MAFLAYPDISIGIADAVAGVVGLEQFPAANGTIVFLPATLDQQKFFDVLRQADIEREPLPVLVVNDVTRLPQLSFPVKRLPLENERCRLDCVEI